MDEQVYCMQTLRLSRNALSDYATIYGSSEPQANVSRPRRRSIDIDERRLDTGVSGDRLDVGGLGAGWLAGGHLLTARA